MPDAPTPPHSALRASDDPTARWREFLAAELDCPVTVVYTRARKMPIRIRTFRTEARGARGARITGLEVRMHAMFDTAPPDVHQAVASWIRSGNRASRACRVLDDWIQHGLAQLPPPKERSERLVARGHHRDLAELLKDVLATDFARDASLHARPPRITWGRRAPSRSRGGLRLGSYDPDLHRVRIHPALDQPAVPLWFVRYVVFHEVLHALHPPVKDSDGRWIHHGREFRKKERAYADYRRVLAWEKEHLRALVRSARRGEPMKLGPEPFALARPIAANVAQPSTDRTPRANAAVPSSPPSAGALPAASVAPKGREPRPAGDGALLPRAVRYLQRLFFD
ncbi:MAG: M48 family metallopeptidase [Planctomycetes bacterium]|nr:M48 family metallopeptidase [Planctomycetota bacterium]